MRAHPHLYEINTWPWLDDLSRRAGRHLTLGGVPDREWDHLRQRGIDIVYLMGIWERSAFGRQIARAERALFGAFDQALPGWTARDVVGSAYCISAYEPDRRIGTWEDLADIRARLHARSMQLMVDFIPNHTGFDHPWVHLHPDRYVQGDESAFRANPGAFRAVEMPSGDVRFIACARDPYFPPWTDVAQLDYSNDDTRAAMIDVLDRLARVADGARCDMAMLMLSDIFSGTWREYLRTPMPGTPGRPGREFWAEARTAVRRFTLLAEVYWDLEHRLQNLGFDFTYDKGLYDRLLHSSAADVRGHLLADGDYQRRSARFIENHDEPPSVLHSINRHFRYLWDSEMFATAVYGVVDAARGTLRISCAGHPPPLGTSRTATSSSGDGFPAARSGSWPSILAAARRRGSYSCHPTCRETREMRSCSRIYWTDSGIPGRGRRSISGVFT